MTSFERSLVEGYWDKGYSAEVDTWLFMKNPINVTLMLAAYLAFVLKIGPTIMKNRPAMELKITMIVYNAVQVLFSIFLVWKLLQVKIPLISMFSPSCDQKLEYTPATRIQFAEASWWYHIAKVTEFLDTIFFVLRKRDRQVSFLHVYHHSVTMYFSWLFLKYAPGEQGAIVGAINSSVHVVMYAYYLISAMGPAYQKYLWWKKYMTVMQLVQFCMIIAYLSLLSLSSCDYPIYVTYFFVVNSFIFLFMFLNFYRKSYTKSTKSIGSLKTATNGTKTSSQGFVSNDEAYLQIAKDADLIGKAKHMCKAE